MCLQDDGAVTTLVVAVPCRGLPGVVPQVLQAGQVGAVMCCSVHTCARCLPVTRGCTCTCEFAQYNVGLV